MDRETCANCQWPYPDFILSSMTLFDRKTGMRATEPICGICALELGNQFMVAKRTKFNGQVAEFNRQLAIEWRQKHTELKPSESEGENNGNN